jgi:endonuclease-3 related protein
MAMYRAMRKRFGHQHWWPTFADRPTEAPLPPEAALEVCVGAILTQNTNWGNVQRAIVNLAADGCMSVARLHAKPPAALAKLIRPAGYFNVKARRLKNFIAAVHKDRGGDIGGFLAGGVAELRARLLSVNGIGPETADSIILYAAGKATFVVDAYTRRILSRHGLIGGGWSYDAIKELFESSLPADVQLWNDYHAQLVAVGKSFCRPVARCKGCPLARFRRGSQ